MVGDLSLGVNIDHVATLRNARDARYPSPVFAAQVAEQAGADHITVHLREDRRHVGDEDVRLIKALLQTRMNLQMALNPSLLDFVLGIAPQDVCLVPADGDQQSTSHGLDVRGNKAEVGEYIKKLNAAGVRTSVLLAPDFEQIRLAQALGAQAIELDTGRYAGALDRRARETEYARVKVAAEYAANLGLVVSAGHGLNYHNAEPIAAIAQVSELNIGHAIIAQALIVGLPTAVREMKMLMIRARLTNRRDLAEDDEN
ncbi:pyridoxine 5'-phosphate synthase [Silvimonas iriomotensis]|uniref:Pyridoxine 5'-phosphate synthase n=1 Tax=Silvimonas iriomotensis TaxID=449662 RepID=A0ABQ2P7H3_9NEIS|nr:pyridoxine 5'-phosphate synthase [Silvimonas iriomotensis]GGP19818.1 pyridoxine 5'-phosphate synthase [Silvimonas iriomotensis]